MTTPTLSSLLVQRSQADIFNAALALAQRIGLPVRSWQSNDPTRSLYLVESTELAQLEAMAVGFVESGFLDFCAIPFPDGTPNPWLAILATQVYGVEPAEATFAEADVVLTNAGGATYIVEPGDLTFKNSTTGATYHNADSGALTGGSTLTLHVVADLPGSGSSAGAGEIDALETTLLGVTVSNTDAAVGLDAEAPATTVKRCRDKASSLSACGPTPAYESVALDPQKTGTTAITRVRVYDDSETGAFPVYVASSSGTVSGGDVTAVQNAINEWAAPLCMRPTVISANPVTVAVTYSLWLYSSVGLDSTAIEAAVQSALEAYFAARPIGGDIIPPASTGVLYIDELKAVIGRVFPADTFRVTVSAPSGDTALANGDVAVLGAVTPTVNIVPGV